jgi:hypothetical protein
MPIGTESARKDSITIIVEDRSDKSLLEKIPQWL